MEQFLKRLKEITSQNQKIELKEKVKKEQKRFRRIEFLYYRISLTVISVLRKQNNKELNVLSAINKTKY